MNKKYQDKKITIDYGNYSSSSLVYLVISILLAYTLKKWEQIGYYVNSDIKINISTCDYLSITEKMMSDRILRSVVLKVYRLLCHNRLSFLARASRNWPHIRDFLPHLCYDTSEELLKIKINVPKSKLQIYIMRRNPNKQYTD
jgi:hypothetical protein